MKAAVPKSEKLTTGIKSEPNPSSQVSFSDPQFLCCALIIWGHFPHLHLPLYTRCRVWLLLPPSFLLISPI